jgi:gamma-glutamyltranspeptidase
MHNQYGHMPTESLVKEARRIAGIVPTQEEQHLLRELADRLATVEGFRRGFFAAVPEKEFVLDISSAPLEGFENGT